MLENLDAATYVYFHDFSAYGRDKNNIYYNDKKINADRASFRIIGRGYAIDKDYVYIGGEVDDKHDVKTFNIKDMYFY